MIVEQIFNRVEQALDDFFEQNNRLAPVAVLLSREQWRALRSAWVLEPRWFTHIEPDPSGSGWRLMNLRAFIGEGVAGPLVMDADMIAAFAHYPKLRVRAA